MKQALVSDIATYVQSATSLDDLTDVLVENNSTFIGNEPSSTSTASNNVALGAIALTSITTGDDNTGVGYNALTGLTEGSKNVAVGKDAMSSGTVTGDGNMAVGYNALKSVTSGNGNVAIGRQVFSSLTSGGKNVGIGRMAGIDNDAGSAGSNALTTGDNNTYIGAEADPSGASVSNETVIGYGATGKGSNTVTIGNGSVTLFSPSDDNEVDLGSSSVEFKNLYIDGTANLDVVDIDGGAIDGAAIGANSASTGAFTTVTTSTSVDITGSTGLILENDETITNSTDGTVSIGGNLSGTGTISGFNAALNTPTANYTLVASDNGKVIAMNSGSALTLTIPLSLGDGFNCLVVQKGAGQVTIVAATDVTISNRSSETKTAGRYAIVTVVNIGSEAYILAGDTGS
jgi:hypothetical protein